MASPDAFPGRLSPFRTGFLKVELFYDGAWQDITGDVSDAGVRIQRSTTQPSTCELALRNSTGKYSPRNPRSPLFGKIGRNTPLRVSTQMQAGGPVSYRFTGEVSEWPQRWGRKGAPSAYSPIVASGILRRLGQGASPLRSPIRRAITTAAASTLVGYWPMEEPEGSEAFSSVFAGHKPATWRGVPTLAAYAGFVCSEPLPTLGSASIRAVVPTYTPVSGKSSVRWLTRVPTGPADQSVMLRIFCSGTLAYLDVTYRTGGGDVTVTGYDREGASVGSNTYDWNFDGQLLRASIDLTQSGGNIAWTFATIKVGDTSGLAGGGTFTGVTLGRVRSWEFNPRRVAFGDAAVGHVTVERDITSLFTVSTDVLKGYRGEKATDRITRLCGENAVAITTTGGKPVAEQMGPQTVATLLELLDDAVDVGQGVLLERRDLAGLQYRTIEDLYNETPELDVAYVDNLFRPFEPTDDDDGVRNKVTVQRAGGASATVERTDGPLSVLPPPNGVGVYDEALTLSLDVDARTEPHAGWRVNLGTHDEPRWPVIGVDLADSYWRASTARMNAALAVDLGDVVAVGSLPEWLPPGQIKALVVGHTEQIQPHAFTIEWATVPARPYDVATYSAGAGPGRYTSAGTVTSGALTAGATSVPITFGACRWGRPDGDFDVVIGGERMRVTAVTAPSGTAQTFTVVRAVNGVSKAHAAGAAVELADPYRYAL